MPPDEGRTWPPETAGLLKRSTFPPAGTVVSCAVSGGPDSLAMLALACAAGCEAHAVYVDHGLRPGTDQESALVARAALQMGATFECVAVRVAPGPDLEARARRARYDALPPGVLTGHTADDQAETLLLNLLRGSGLDGLRGMTATGGGRRQACRPILALRRTETAGLVGALGLAVVHDPTNDDGRFRRNRVRHEMIPLMASVADRDIVPVLARTAAILAEDGEYLERAGGEIDPHDVRALRSAPRPLAVRALRQWLRQGQGDERYPPSRAEIDRVWGVVLGTVKACQLADGRRVSRSKGRLEVAPDDIR